LTAPKFLDAAKRTQRRFLHHVFGVDALPVSHARDDRLGICGRRLHRKLRSSLFGTIGTDVFCWQQTNLGLPVDF